MTPAEIPNSGYQLLGVYARRQQYELKPEPEEGDEHPPDEERTFSLEWDWRIIEARRFDVRLAIGLEPSHERPERAFIDLVGQFSVLGSPKSLSIEGFVHVSAPAILFPFARSILANLSSTGPYGSFQAPIIHVAKLMKDFPYEESEGAKQLQGDTKLAAEFRDAFDDSAEPSGEAQPASSE